MSSPCIRHVYQVVQIAKVLTFNGRVGGVQGRLKHREVQGGGAGHPVKSVKTSSIALCSPIDTIADQHWCYLCRCNTIADQHWCYLQHCRPTLFDFSQLMLLADLTELTLMDEQRIVSGETAYYCCVCVDPSVPFFWCPLPS